MPTDNSDRPSSESDLPFDKALSYFEKENRAGLAVMAIQNGKTVFKKGYGLRDIENGLKIDCDTNFDVASVSKQFCAMGVAILEERNKISVEDGIGKYLPDLPAYMKDIKVRHLVHHLGGLQEYDNELWSTDKTKPLISNHDVYDWYKKKKRKLKRRPGEKFEYSNGGYSLLGLIVENVADEPFHEFMHNVILKPAGMNSSAFITYPSIIKNQSKTYSDWPFFRDIGFNTGNYLFGEGGLYTSVNDMQGWIHGLETNLFVSAKMMKKVMAPVKTNSGKKVKYGYGWEFEKLYGHKVIGHGGSWLGFQTVIINVPKEKLWLVAFSNSYAIGPIAAMRRMAEYYLQPDPKKYDLFPSLD